MNLNTVATVSEVATRLGRSPSSIRSLIRTGELPATQIGYQWFIEEDSIGRVGPRETFVGRPLSQRVAWSMLSKFEGRLPIHSLHRQEKARLNGYVAQSHEELRYRLRGRASFLPFSATSGAISRLKVDQRWVIGGGAAAARHLGVEEPPGPATFYVRRSLEDDFLDASLAVPDVFQPNLVLALVEDINWPFDLEIDHYAWGSVTYLDCHEQHIDCPNSSLLWPLLASNLHQHGETRDEGRIDIESAVD